MMNRLIYILIVLNIFTHKIYSQEIESEKEIIAIAKLVEANSTGKRHDSFFFTFKIKKVVSGELNDSIITFQEIYSGFGATAIFKKLYPKKSLEGINQNLKAKTVVVKFTQNKKLKKNNELYTLKWVAEKHRRKRLESLELLLKKRGVNVYDSNLLNEEGGKLFFSENGINKIAVEVPSGDWIFATVEE